MSKPRSEHRIEQLLAVARCYQDTQPNGIKEVEQQLALFAEDTVFISFPIAQVVGSNEPRLLMGKAALREAFLSYNVFAKQAQSLAMTYHHAYAYVDPETNKGVCGFTLLIQMREDEKLSVAMNHLQLHVNEDNLIDRSVNWQAQATPEIVNQALFA